MKKTLAFILTLMLSFGSLFFLFTGQAFASSHVCTWTGASDSNFSTAANWTNCNGAAPNPSDDDSLIFPYGTGVTNKSPHDNLSNGTTFRSITFSGTSSGAEDPYVLDGNSIDLDGTGLVMSASGNNISPTIENNLVTGADWTIEVDNGSLTLSGVISGGANISKTGVGILALSGDNTFTGPLDASAGSLYASSSTALGSTSSGTSIDDGADLFICDSSLTIAEPLTLTGASSNTTGDFPTPKLETSTGVCSGGGGATENYGFNNNGDPVTLSGDMTLGSDVTFATLSQTTITGHLSGNFNINLVPGYSGQLVVDSSSNSSDTSNATYTPAIFTKTLSDDQISNSVSINDGAIITITGIRGDVTMNGGELKGTGTIGALDLEAGTVAPGMSPGILKTGNLTFNGGTYQAQLGGTTSGHYDQLKVTGSIDLGSSTVLDTSLYGGFKPTSGNSFTIIDNDGSDPVSGTFQNLKEGASFKVNGYTFKITYKGGTGNDVVLSLVSTASETSGASGTTPPKAPDTGIALITHNPILSVGLLCVVAPGLALAAARRNQQLNVKR